ncbi:MAG: hypothetical protein AB1505_25285 [Candidatus Latescibacterota bacterium]
MGSRSVLSGACCLVLGYLAACHDHPRDNPLDPTLTPQVAITTVTVDTLAGTARIEWTPYAGSQPFGEYRVIRKVQGMEADTTLGVLTEVAQTAFEDTTVEPDRDYRYWVAVVNRGGLVVRSAEAAATSFQIRGVALLGVQADPLQGSIQLTWQRYCGPDFEGYEVWRRSYGQEDARLAAVSAAAETVWTDRTPAPATGYTYWVATAAAGRRLESAGRGASYPPLPVALQSALFSHRTAAAELRWTKYRGPGFLAYEVHRHGAGQDTVVALAEALGDTTCTDGMLEGNTVYEYRVRVRTVWADLEVASNPRRGDFYRLSRQIQVPTTGNLVQAVQLAWEEPGRLHVALTSMAATTAHRMVAGVSLWSEGGVTPRSFFSQVTPERRTPVRLATYGANLYVAVQTSQDSILIGVVAEGRTLWQRQVAAGGALPVGLHVDADSTVLVVDEDGRTYWVRPPDLQPSRTERLSSTLAEDRPVEHALMVAGAGAQRNPLLFLVAPQRAGNHLIARVRSGVDMWGGKSSDYAYDDGVGPGRGQTLSPLVLAYDPAQARLLVLESQGRLQVLDARPVSELDGRSRYVTQWGRFGSGPGEFLPSPPTAASVVLDPQGRVYVGDVVDGVARVQVFEP